MNAVETVVERLHGVRRVGGRIRAKCPAHGSRGLTLSVSEGNDGRALLRCHAGCDVGAIAGAIGLSVRDLFAASERPLARPRLVASQAEIEAFLVAEVGRQRSRRLQVYPYGQPAYLSEDVNSARRRANAIFGLHLAPIAPFLWEGFAPHDTDAAWPALFARALEEVRFERRCIVDPFALPDETNDAPVYTKDLTDAGERAAGWLRSEAQR